MNIDQWNRLSDWHNAWLEADAAGRHRLRDELAATQPDLLMDADALVAGSGALATFLETPAFVLAAQRMARLSPALAPGASVGPYRIAGVIGQGGMGVVYRATDPRLDRDVALKMLAPAGIPDKQAIERFVREARLTASIDHPNVIKVYDVGVDDDGQPYMVVELLEGETLRDLLNRGPVAVPLTRRIAVEIARGLTAAHARGLVHRDLKPENVFLTRSGATRILDFGVAKLAPDAAARPRAPESTLTAIVLGTAGYLAPEQIRGDEVDGRADLFALGSILFELLTGQRAFACENTVDTLHAILHAPPPPLLEEQSHVPQALTAIVLRLLEKRPADRFQSAADLVWSLDHLDTAAVPANRDARIRDTRRARRPWVPSRRALISAAASLLLATIVGAAWWFAPRGATDSPGTLARFSWTLPAGTGLLSPPTVSPDGSRICWVGVSDSAPPRLFVRNLSSADPAAIPATEFAAHPFWSPDGRWIGFFARGKLKKVPADGGPPVVLADAPQSRGGAWAPGVIVFAPDYRDAPLMRVSDQGGPAQPATVLDRTRGDIAHRWPAFLPDGRHFLFSVTSMNDERRGIYLASVDGPANVPAMLFPSDSNAFHVSTGKPPGGILVSTANDRLVVYPFDPVRRALAGSAYTIDVGAAGATPHQAALVSASGGLMVYGPAMVPWGARFASIGRDGSDLRLLSERELGGFPRVSPDGKSVARSRVDPLRGNPDIWLDDFERGTQLRLTTSSDHDVVPVWSPDGRQVAFRSGTVREPTIGFAAADGTFATRTLACPQSPCEPSDWTRDGALIVTVRERDIWKMPLEPAGKPEPLLAEAFTERDGRLSPDGRWLAYVSDESGRPEVSVRAMTRPPRRVVVSTDGGDQPVWRHDGKELFFTDPEGRHLYSVLVASTADGRLQFGHQVRLQVPPLGQRHWGTLYDVSADGQRIFFMNGTNDRPPTQIEIVMNWQALLK